MPSLVLLIIRGCLMFAPIVLVLATKNKRTTRWSVTATCIVGIATLIGSAALNQQFIDDLTENYFPKDTKLDIDPDDIAYTDGEQSYTLLSNEVYPHEGSVTVDLSREPSDKLVNWMVNSDQEALRRQDVFIVEIDVRKKGTKKWLRSLKAEVGDKVEFQIHFRNTTYQLVEDVNIAALVPENIKFTPHSEMLYNTSNPDGMPLEDDELFADGINAGGYKVGGDAYVRFEGTVSNVSLHEGLNRLVTNAKATANGKTLIGNASVYVERE